MLKKIGREFGAKAGVMLIMIVFIAGAFSPAVGTLSTYTEEKNVEKNEQNSLFNKDDDSSDTFFSNDYLTPDTDESISDFKGMKEQNLGKENLNMLLGSRNPSGPWWDTDWFFRKGITIDHTKVDSDLNNFPILISLSSDSNLASNAQSSGGDIVFTNVNGVKLNHEIEFYNSTSGDLICWVNVTSLSSTQDTVLYMYYGNAYAEDQQNPIGVWDSDFVMVQHLNETSGMHYDSTVYGNNATDYGSDQDAVGVIDGANDFDGSSSYLEVPHDESITGFTDAFTASAWIKMEDITGGNNIFCKYYTTTNQRGWMFEVYDGELHLATSPDGAAPHYWWRADFPFVVDVWYLVGVVWESDEVPVFYLNGTEVDITAAHENENPTISQIFNNDGTPLHIGKRSYSTGNEFDGVLDELRISDSTRDASWFATEYSNHVDPDSFYSVGDEVDVNAPLVYDENPVDGIMNISVDLSNLSFNLTDYQGNLMNYSVETVPNVGSDSQNEVGNNTYYISVYNLEGETVYTWYVNVTDGVYETNMTFVFTTERDRPVISDEQPEDGAFGVDLNPLLQAEITDYQGDSVDWSIWSNASDSWSLLDSDELSDGNGTISTANTGDMDEYGNTYWWSVNVTDTEGSGSWTNTTYQFTTIFGTAPWWNETWLYRKEIVIYHDMVEENLTNFPVIISLVDSDLEVHAQSSGEDIVFTDYYGNQLAHDIEFYDAGELVVWVNVTSLSSVENTTLYMYYGNLLSGDMQNISDVWDSDYVLVQHLDEAPDNDVVGFFDSTIYGNDGAPKNFGGTAGSTTDAIGMIDGAVELYRADASYIDCGNDNSLNLGAGDFTISVWARKATDEFQQYDTIYSKGRMTNAGEWILYEYTAKNHWNFYGDSSKHVEFDADCSQKWAYIVIVRVDDQMHAYVNGEQVTITADEVSGQNIDYTSTKKLVIGARNEGTEQHFSGKVDELRISDSARDASWIVTEYSNQVDPEAFYDVGPEISVGYPTVKDESPMDGAVGVSVGLSELSFNLTDYKGRLMNYSVETVPDVGSDEQVGLGNDSYSVPISVDRLQGETLHTWYVNVTNGEYETNMTFVFTTERDMPVISDEQPEDGAAGVDLNPLLQATVSDNQGDSVDWSIWSNASDSWSLLESGELSDGNGTVSTGNTGDMDEYGTTYWWSVNVSDTEGSGSWTNITFCFKTSSLLTDWRYQKEIVIDHDKVEGNLVDFPLLIDIVDDVDLAGHAQLDFDDILFTDDSVGWDTGSMEDRLPHEIESYDSSTGNLTVWVRIPSLSGSSDTVLYMYYGNTECDDLENLSGVWDSDFVMVQHLNETSGMHYDSTVYGNNATDYGSDQNAVGVIDGADSFDGSSSYLEVPHDESITGFTDAFTASAWIKADANTLRQTIFCKYVTTGNQRGWMVDFYDDTGVSGYWTIQLCASPNGESPHSFWLAPFQPVIREWYYITVVWESNQEAKFYINGEEIDLVGSTGTISNIFNNDGAPLHIGKSSYSAGREFDGVLDELRISASARDASWIVMEYSNQVDPDSFYSLGDEVDVNAPLVYDENPVDGMMNVSLGLSSLSFKLTDYQGNLMNYSVETVPDVGSDSQDDVGNNTYYISVYNLEGETVYTWYVNVTDGIYDTNETFTFITESDIPLISDEYPMDGAVGVGMNPLLQADIVDLQGDSVNWYIRSNAGGSWTTFNSGTLDSGSGTVSASSSFMDTYGTMYYWSVNASDAGSGEWSNVTFTFTTINKIEVTNPHPGDGESWVSLNPELFVDVEDRHGDPVTVMFWTNASGSWKNIGSVSGGNETYTQKARDMLQRDNTTYYWSVNVSDGMGSWTNKTYSLILVDYKGQRVQPVSKGFCWKLPDVRPAVEQGIYYENAMQGGGTWAKYDINQGWVKTYATLFHSGYCGHNTFGFWDDVYHVIDGSSSSPCHFELVDSLEANFESFSTIDKYEDLYYVGLGGLNFTDTCPRTYSFSNDKAWILTGELCTNNNTWLVEYFEWTNESGWSGGQKIWATGTVSGSRVDFSPCLLRYNKTTWYLYYVRQNGGTHPMKYVKTMDAGQTWSSEQTCTDISCPASVATRTSFARYGNNFYIFIRAGNGDAVAYYSTDMENWGNMQVIDSSHNYWMVSGNMLHQSALICVGANNVEYVDDIYAMIQPIDEMIANPETPTNPYPANNRELTSGTTTIYLNVTVHGDQVYDVAFYWLNGTFIGEDKILEEGDIASIQVTGLQNNTEYSWYAITRGTIDEYIGREPMTMSDENWTDVFTFEVKAQPQPMITNEQPEDGAVDINPNPTPTLQATITDFQGDSVDWYILSNVSDSWMVLESGTLPDGNGTISNTSSLMNEYSTTYYWSVNASDGVLWTNETYQFTTIRGRPIISGEQPTDGAVNVDPVPTLQATIADLQGDTVDWYIMSNASGSWTVFESGTLSDGNGTVSLVSTVMDRYEITYYWSVNASDGLLWCNQTFYFTTVRGRPYVSDEQPENDGVGVDLNPTLKVLINDMQNDSVDWWIMSNASGSWTVITSSTLPNGNGLITANPVTMDQYNTTYYWSVNATDGVLWENKTYCFTSKAAPGPWWNEGWMYRKTITINHDFVYANSNLTDFPMLIDITDAELSAHSQPGGGDIVFTNYSGIKLNHEIEYYDNSSGNLIVWVNITQLSSDTETTLYMYYGNVTCSNQEDPLGVWNNNYTMIHHLDEQTGTHYDSTSYANHGSPHGVTQDVTGHIDGADQFNETPVFYSADISINSNGGNGYYTAIMNIQTGAVDGPVLKYSPRSNHFGSMYAGNTASTSFDVWNDGTEDTTFSCSEDCEWLSLPGVISGISHSGGGDVDTVDVDIDTTGLGPGDYSGEVEVLSGYGYSDVFTVHVHVIDTSVSTPLMFHNPDSYFFRNMGSDDTDSTTFEIWNGGTDTLSYSLSEDAEWVSVSPTSGSSTGEHDTISVSVDTSSILIGNYIEVNDDPSLDHADGEEFTYTAWINSEQLSDYKAIITHRDPGSDAVVGIWTYGDNLYCEVKNDGRTSTATGSASINLSTDSWYYIGLTRSSTDDIYLWINGNSYYIGTCTGDITPSESLYVGWHSVGGQNFIGKIDEVRLSNIERSQGWILTTYYNQYTPSLFHTFGSEEINEKTPVISDEQPVDNAVELDVNPILQASIIDYQEDSVDWWIMSNASGPWSAIASGNLPFGEGTVFAIPSTMSNYNTTYYWSVNCTDLEYWNNQTYCFTTYQYAPGPWWNSSWLYRKMILINHSMVEANSDLYNFPVLINITDSDLSARAQFDGDDLMFTDYYGDRLAHEIEFYDGNVGELVAWVNVTTLSGDDDTMIYLYYGNMGCDNQESIQGVWDSDYRMVQHLPHNWIPYEDNPVGVGGMKWHSVFKVDDTYYAYYHGSNQIERATSPDGKTWTDDNENNPVLPPSASGWDSTIGVPWAFYEDGTYYILYYGYSGTNSIGLATSSDGVSFTKYPNNETPEPVISGSAEPWGVMKVNDTYYEYYVNNGYMGNRVICLATSTDLINWTKYPGNPIFKTGVSEPDANGQFNSDVFTYNGYYYILIPHYTAGSDYAGIELYRDTTPFFSESTREYLGFVLPCPHSQTDQDTPAVFTDDVYRNSFDGSGGELWTYYAYSTNLAISPSIPQALKGAMRDSTVYGNHGVGDGVGGPNPCFCKIGGGYNFDGLDEYMLVDDKSSLDLDSSLTLEVWVQLDTALISQPNTYSSIISKKDNDLGYGIWFNCSDEILVVSIGSTEIYVDVSSYDWTSWHQIIVSYDGSILYTYIDKDLIDSESVSGAIGVNDNDLWIGDQENNRGNVPDGNIDEIRISDQVRDWNWLNTSYNNQVNPGLFVGLRSEERAVAPIVSDETPSDNAVNISPSLDELSFYIEDLQGDPMDYTVVTSPDIGSSVLITDVPNGTYSVSVSGLQFNTTYVWYVNVSDGVHSTNETFSFTTKSGKPIVYDEYPADGSIGVVLNPTLEATCMDYEGDSVDWYILSNASIGSWQVVDSGTLSDGNGTFDAIASNMNQYNTSYWWSVNVTDPSGSGSWVNNTFCFTTELPPAPWWNNDWQYRKAITLNQSMVMDSLVDFPVLIDVDDIDFDLHAQSSGDDIVFCDYYGNSYSHEIEYYDSGHLIVWVNVTSLSSVENTTLYMYYGNPSCSSMQNPVGVWDSNFVMVHHLKDETGSSVNDSTVNNHDGLKKAADQPVEIDAGKIDSAQDFSGSDYISVDDADDLDHLAGEEFTYSAWFNSDLLQTGDYKAIFSQRESMPIVGLWTHDESKIHYEVKNDDRSSQTSGDLDVGLSTDTWYYVVLSRDTDGNIEVWFNDTSNSCGVCTGPITPSQDLYIGRHSSGTGQDFDGIIDEVRLSNILRSDAWIQTCFNNQRDPSGFYSVGVELEKTVEEPVVSDEQPVNGSIGVDFNPLLQANVSDDQGDSVDWYILSNASIGSWQVLNSGTLSDGNGTISATSTGMGSYDTTYYWSVNVSDGTLWTNKTYHFTTEANVPPTIQNENPVNGSVGVSRWPTCNVTVSDENDNMLTVCFYEDTTGSWVLQQTNTSVSSGSNVVWSNYSNASSYYTTYNWAVNVSDGVHWTNKTYHFTTEFTPASWWNTSWHIRKKILIDHSMVNSTLSNFPVLIRTIDSDLSYYAQNNGNDIVFTDYSANKLSHEIEYYDNSTGELICWVNVTSLSSDADTALYMYYGNTACGNMENVSGVWNLSHRLVYHLDETSGTHYDSTIFDNSGSPSGGLNQDVTGLIDGCDEFDGTNSQITTNDDDSLDFGTNSFTITAWINLTKTSTYQAVVEKRNGGAEGFYFDARSDGRLEFKIQDINAHAITGIITSDVCTGNWRYISGVFNRDTGKVTGYVDGNKDVVVDISTVADTINTSTDLHIGYYSNAFPANGLMDEIRISENAMSRDWINTSFLNQRDPSSFYLIGSRETSGAGVPFVSDESPVNNSKQMEFNPLLQVRVTDYENDDVDWYIMSNASDVWSVIDSGTISGGNGLISATPTDMDSYDTTYYWSVNLTDPSGSDKWKNETFCFTTTFAPGPWWNSSWLYRRMILINHSMVEANSDLYNFPVLINITDSDLSAHAQFDGDDFVFTDYNGDRLPHEIEFYNGNVGELVAWVNVSTLYSTLDTKLYVYYGNPSCDNQENITFVWGSDYRMVQHLPHNWIPYEGNPVSAPGTSMQWHSVFKVDDTYYAYYHGSNQINRATSSDGKNWIDDTANNPVLPPNATGWDSIIGVPWAFYENGTYYILYYGYSGTNAIGLATSSDGVSFTKYPNNTSPEPVITNAEPWGLMKINDTYYEYYCQNSGPGGRCVCLATSTDLVNWTKDPNNPIFTLGVDHPGGGCFNSDVFKYGSYYYILIPQYTSGTDYARIVLYRDTNPTFYPEDREYLGPVKPVSHVNTWEMTDQDTPAVLTDTVFRDTFNDSHDELWMYYNGCCSRKQGLTISPSIPQALKGGMRDSTVYSNHGDSGGVGGPVPEFSIVGGGINVDDDEYMFIPHDDSLNVTDELMVSVWVKLDNPLTSHTNSYPGIISKRDDSTSTGYGLWFNTSDECIVGYIGTGTDNYLLGDVSGFDLTEWHLFTLMYNGSSGQAQIFVDRERVYSGLLTGDIVSNSVDLWVGDLVHLSGNNLLGSVDEIRISNRTCSWSWINTSFDSQISPGVFAIGGIEENFTSGDIISPELTDVSIIFSDPIDTDPAFGWENITCKVTDNTNVDAVKVNVSDPDTFKETFVMTKIGDGDTYYYNTTFTDFGSYSYFIWANDTSDNQNTSSTYVFDLPPNYDIDSDGSTFIMDINLVALLYGSSVDPPGSIREDVDNDGVVMIMDINMVALHFGESWT